ncbi:MAG: patatin-like phospholipase family protein [Elusimicrobia bacterium]|nr:patatin-like phospholipase family protein [Elusimicrobiota bacterium]
MTPEELAAWEPFLKAIPLFAGLSSADVARVARRMQALSLPKGATLYSEGSTSDAFYIITSGQVRTVRTVGGREVVDAFLGRGETLGEGGLLTGEPHLHAAKLDTTTEFLKLLRKDFESLLRKNPSILLHLSRLLARRLVRAHNPAPGAPAQLIALSASLPGPDRRLLAVHLGLQLVSQTRRRVFLADLSSDAGGVAQTLGLKPRPAERLAADPGHVHEHAWVEGLIQTHPSGLEVLSFPASVLAGRLYGGLYHFLNFLREGRDIVLVCCDEPSSDVERSILAEADRVLWAGGRGAPGLLAGAQAAMRAAVPETAKVLGLWLGDPPGADEGFGPGIERVVLPWPDDLGARLERTGSPYEAMDGRPRTLRAVERLARRLGGVRLGLALGAGAALGHSYIGMLKVFAREHIPIDVVAGTSAGALIGGWLAAGLEPEQMVHAALRMDKAWLYENLFWDITLPRSGFFAGQTLLRFLRTFFGEKEFAELELPFACVATDIETGEAVVLREGRVAEAVRASCGLPIIYAPMHLGGRYLVDGGLVDPVPVRVAAELGADLLVAVNLTLPAAARNPRRRQQGLLEASLELDFARLRELTLPAALQAPNMLQVFNQTLHTMEYEIARTRMEFAHVAIQPDLSAFLWTETHRSREIIRAGERVAEQYVPQIKALLPFFTQLGKVPRRPSSPLQP